ncbi:MAG: hypothetical protein DRH37_05445 [Deltaproteobacteria bacterium]|nr:MAG: hypothetical protein DRH37_05445 [Deltaproteobacteria bacterium]
MGIPYDQYKQEVFAALAAENFNSIYGGLPKAKSSGNGWMLARCPFHEDKNPSFGFNTQTGQWACFRGCGKGDVWDFLMRDRSLPFKELLLEMGSELGIEPPQQTQVAEKVYSYHDQDGRLLYQVVKRPGKKFSQRRPGEGGSWIWNLKGTDRVLYRLPELMAADPKAQVFIVEGEKDADRLHDLGLLATTSPGGAGKWKDRYSDVLKDRDVIILPDNDQPGRDHAEQVARSLNGKARSVTVVTLQDLPEKGDVSDWLDRGGTRDQLLALAEKQGPWRVFKGDNTRPVIQIHGRQLRDLVHQVWKILLAQNDPPRLFRTAGGLARVVTDDDSVQMDLLDEAKAYGLLIRCADWFTQHGGHDIAIKPPKEIAKDLLANPDPALPYLEGIITAPVFDRDWRLLTVPGYHPEARLWLSVPKEAMGLKIPTYPTQDDLQRACSLILDDLLVDFPFTADSDRAHAVAALLLPFTRPMFTGPTPIHLIEAPTPGSGKSLLSDLIAQITTGKTTGCTTLTANEEEARKKLTSILSRGSPVIAIDNLQGGLWSAQVAAAITAEVWEDRLLGKSQMVSFPNRALWLVSANNPKLSMEIARRCIRIRIDPGQEQPWKRTGFKHDPIREWVHQNRWELVRAILTLVQGWIAADAPHAQKTLGSFEAWSRVIGGMVEFTGLPGFLQDTDEFYETADPESSEWRAFVQAWWETYKDRPVNARDLLQLAMDNDLVTFAYAAKSEQSQRARFGRSLSRLRGRRFGDNKVALSKDSHKKVRMFRLAPVNRELFL